MDAKLMQQEKKKKMTGYVTSLQKILGFYNKSL